MVWFERGRGFELFTFTRKVTNKLFFSINSNWMPFLILPIPRIRKRPVRHGEFCRYLFRCCYHSCYALPQAKSQNKDFFLTKKYKLAWPNRPAWLGCSNLSLLIRRDTPLLHGTFKFLLGKHNVEKVFHICVACFWLCDFYLYSVLLRDSAKTSQTLLRFRKESFSYNTRVA